MRIIHLDAGKEWRGGQKQVLLLHQGLIAAGHDSFLLAHKEGALYRECLNQNIKNCSPWNYINRNSSITKGELLKQLDTVQPQIIHYHDSLAVNYAKHGKAFKILTRRVSYPIKWISRITKYKYIHQFVGVSQSITSYLNRYFKKCSTIHSSIDLAYFQKTSKKTVIEKSEKTHLLFVGAYSKQKGIPILLNALEKLVQNNPFIHLHLCGDGELKSEISKIILKKELNTYVTQHGTQHDIAAFYQQCDFVIVPSINGEGSSGTIKEGIACGKPVIASDFEPNKELIRNGENGFLFENKNHQALCNLLDQLINNKTPFNREKILSSSSVFSSEKMIEKYITTYNNFF